MIKFEPKHPRVTNDMLGLLPYFLFESDPRPAREQLDDRYAHGGGWSPFRGFTMTSTALEYPGDPPMLLLAEAWLRDETLRFYEGEWLAVVQPDGSYEVSRVD